MTEQEKGLAYFNTPQKLFVGYTLAVLVDLLVLNFLDEYWEHVSISSFTVSLGAAILLQFLLKMTIGLEHRLADYFKSKPGTAPKIYRGITTYIILVGSKFVMLGIIDWAFGDAIVFTGAWNGIVAFFVVVFAILIAESIVGKIYVALGDKE